MENYKSESYSDEESDSSASETSTSHVRHVALPASALHGFGHEAPKGAPEIPRFESVLAAEHQRRQAEAHHESKDDKESDDDDDAPAVAPQQIRPPQPNASEEITPLAAVAEALETFAEEPDEATSELPAAGTTAAQAASQPHASAPVRPRPLATPAEHVTSAPSTEALDQAAIDEQFKQIVEVNLNDLQDLDLPLNEHEPQNLNPSIAEAADFMPAPEVTSAPSAEIGTSMPAQTHETPIYSSASEHQPAPQNDFETWEAEMADQNMPPFPGPAAAPGTGGGNNRPPMPPEGPGMEMPGEMPSPEPEPIALAKNRMSGAGRLFNAALAPAEMLTINSKLQRAEAARVGGDAITGLVAGWALARTFRNRRMIREQARETKKQFQKQERATQELTEQNDRLRQQIARSEQMPAPGQQAMPNRFRPATGNTAPLAAAGAEVLGAKPALAEKPAAPTSEKTEDAIRQETLQTAPDHEVVRSGWHSIELDSKTGKAVENPTGFEYGEAFQQERRSEQLQDKLQDANAPQSRAASNAGATGYGAPQYGMQPAPPLLPAPTPHQQLGAGKQSPAALVKGTGKQLLASAGTPWFWLAIIFLLMVFFGAALL